MTDMPVSAYVDRALDQLRRWDLMRSPGRVPEAMQDPSIPSSGDWIGWKPVPSTVTGADLDSLENETGLRYPPLYRDLLQYLHFEGLTEVGLRFVSHWIGRWREELRDTYRAYSQDGVIECGLLPFGAETLMDAGPVCFDTRHRMDNGDCPIVFWDHDRAGDEESIRPLFSSAAAMFACLGHAADIDVNFVYHDDGDPPDQLPAKKVALRQFLDLDPEGAGGPARDYWTRWGVNPAS